MDQYFNTVKPADSTKFGVIALFYSKENKENVRSLTKSPWLIVDADDTTKDSFYHNLWNFVFSD
jgi:hypothetical protein